VSDTPLQSALRELQRLLSGPRLWAALGGASLLFGLVGPFGTFDALAPLPRLAYWTAIVVATYLAGVSTVYIVMAVFFRQRVPGLPAYAAAGAAAGVPVAAVVIGLNTALSGWQGFGDAARLTLYCIAISAAVSTLVALFSMPASRNASVGQVATPESVASAPDHQRPAILDRLPLNLRGRLAYLSMQDHYVEVHTDKGSTLVLMRLADAIAETRGLAGLRIHRSHWVAIDAVKSSVRRDGRLALTMSDGVELPVSRPYLADVRAAGFGG